VYGHSRRRALFGAVLALLLAGTAFAAARHPLDDQALVLDDQGRSDLAPVRWPQSGQAALLLGTGRPAASPDEQPAPIASLAKLMTVYLTLARYPLDGAQDGFTTTVSEAQARAEARDTSQGQSDVAVQTGEQLTARQLLEALLIASGNNIARMLAAQVAGSQTRFVAEMNAEARALGMDHTIYTDPSGFDPGTISTVGVVLGQGQGSDTPALLAAAGDAARQLVDSVAPALPVRARTAPGAPSGRGRDAGRHGPPLLLAPGRASARN
jgi:D-alanyl-D-alanine carboxypeptidase (penicillin-binding protein 5/6)